MKLDHYKCRKVTKPDFPGKLSNFFYKQFFKKSVFGHFLENAALVLAEISYLTVISYKENSLFAYFSKNTFATGFKPSTNIYQIIQPLPALRIL